MVPAPTTKIAPPAKLQMRTSKTKKKRWAGKCIRQIQPDSILLLFHISQRMETGLSEQEKLKNKEESYGLKAFFLNCKGNRLAKPCSAPRCFLADLRLTVKLHKNVSGRISKYVAEVNMKMHTIPTVWISERCLVQCPMS